MTQQTDSEQQTVTKQVDFEISPYMYPYEWMNSLYTSTDKGIQLALAPTFINSRGGATVHETYKIKLSDSIPSDNLALRIRQVLPFDEALPYNIDEITDLVSVIQPELLKMISTEIGHFITNSGYFNDTSVVSLYRIGYTVNAHYDIGSKDLLYITPADNSISVRMAKYH